MSKILITGANGFIGAAVCKRLRQSRIHMLTGTTRAPSLRAGPEQVPMYYIPEIGPDTDWSHAISGADIVIHLAARVHIMNDKSDDPLATFRRVNTEGTRALAMQAAAAGIKRFVFISTVKVAGENSPEGGFTESDPVGPEDAYSMSKWEAEQALTKIAQKTGMEVVILRPPLVYGPSVGGNFLRLLKVIQNGIPLPLNTVRNKRSLIFVGNLADAIVLTLEHAEAANKTFYVSDIEVVSTPDLIKIISAVLSKSPRLISCPVGVLKFAGALMGKSRVVHPLVGSLSVNTHHIEAHLNWIPPHSMEQGIKATVDWFNKNYTK